MSIKLVIFDFNGVLERAGQIDTELLDYAAGLDAKTAVLTRMDVTSLKIMLLGAGKNPFDALFTPDNSPYLKPALEAFAHVAKHFDLAPEACVMVDDVSINVEGAQSAGMAGILYRGLDDLQQRLEKLG